MNSIDCTGTILIVAAMLACASSAALGQTGGLPASRSIAASADPYGKWTNGPPADANYFPISVWLQDPKQAGKYKEAGINLYVGLWKGPTEEQLAALKEAGMPVICDQNEVGLKHKDDKTIIAWMHGDEPDNAQSLGQGKGYGPPIDPNKIVADYQGIRAADPTRPVMLTLGQAVAWDAWHGRGVRTNHPEDYPEYVKGCDIVSFDIYPVAHSHKDVSGKLWFVARGVDRLREWSKGQKAVWNCIECTRIQADDRKATPHQVRAEVWMSLIHGSQGLIYFVHEWKPKFNEHALLDDPEMLKAVTATNKQIHQLAPVLNSPTLAEALAVSCTPAEDPTKKRETLVDALLKRHGGVTYVFAVNMRDTVTQGSFAIRDLQGIRKVEVLDEGRTLQAENGKFGDQFGAWDVRIYVIR
jgi:hypothetical protein